MTGAARVGVFALVVAAVFAAAAGLGAAVGPLDRGRSAEPDSPHAQAGAHDDRAAPTRRAGELPGLAVSSQGLRLVARQTHFGPRRSQQFSFRIVNARGETVRTFDEAHERRMHLIVVRRDLAHFRHLHPVLRRNGTWTTPLGFPDPGVYRAFADFSVHGRSVVLGVDLFAGAGSLSRPVVSRSGAKGYTVSLDAQRPDAGREAAFTFRVAHKGRPVRVGRYLGARGHLVVLREGDLAYLHTHAEQERLEFKTTFPSAGRYRAFLQYVHAGRVRTAPFTIEVAQ